MSDDNLHRSDFLLCHCSAPPVKVTHDHCVRTSFSDPPKHTYRCPDCGKDHTTCPTCMGTGFFVTDDGTRMTCHNCHPGAARNEDQQRRR